MVIKAGSGNLQDCLIRGLSASTISAATPASAKVVSFGLGGTMMFHDVESLSLRMTSFLALGRPLLFGLEWLILIARSWGKR